MDEETKMRFDALDAQLTVMVDMMSDILTQFDDKNSAAKRNRKLLRDQIESAKKIALNNPMLRNNPQALKQVESMFAVIPGGNEE